MLEVLPDQGRVVVDSNRNLPGDLQMFTDSQPTFIATVERPAETENVAHLLSLPPKQGKVDLAELMGRLGDMQFNEVWVEAGPGLAGALLNAGEVDELIVYQAPKLLGDKAQSMVDLPSFTALSQTISLQRTDSRQLGEDIRMQFNVLPRGHV